MNFDFFKPSKLKVLIFLALALILYFATINTWGFCKDCGVPKPLLYDLTLNIGFWVTNIYLSFPVVIFTYSFGPLFSILVSLMYYYFLSCLLAFFIPYSGKSKMKYILTSFGLLVLLVLVWQSGFFSVQSDSEVKYPSELPSLGFWIGQVILPIGIAIAVYGIIIAGFISWTHRKKSTN